MTIAVSAGRLSELKAAGHEENPMVAHDNLAAGAGVVLGGTAVLADGAAANAVDGNTYDYWLPDVTTTTASFNVDLGSAQTMAFAGIAAHNLADFGASVRLRRSTDGISWSDAGAGVVTPADNGPVVFRCVTSGQDYRHWQFYVTGLTAGDALAVGVAFVGAELVIPDRFYRDFSPPVTPNRVALQSDVSVGGNVLGSAVVSRGSILPVRIGHVAESFIRSAPWTAFQGAFNSGMPFFFGSRPGTHPEDIFYAWRAGAELAPERAAVRDYRAIAFDARAYSS